MVSEGNLFRAQFGRDAIEMPSSKPGTEGTGGLTFRDKTFDDGIGVTLFNVERNSDRCEIFGEDVSRKSWLFLVQIDRHQVELDWRPTLQDEQQVQQSIAVLAAGKADHNFIALLDETIVTDRLPDLAQQSSLQLFGRFVQLVEGRAMSCCGRHGGYCTRVLDQLSILRPADCGGNDESIS